MAELIWKPGTTYDDWLVLPGRIKKDVTVDNISLKTPLTKYNSSDSQEVPAENLPEDVFVINSPLLSAPMQSVTGAEMAIELAKQGCLGVIFCSQPINKEAGIVRQVKGYKAAFVVPDVFSPETIIEEVIKAAEEKGYSTFPITDNGKPNGRIVGLLTKNDYSEKHRQLKACDRMIPMNRIIYARYEKVGEDIRKANAILENSHHGSIPIVDKHGHLKFMVFKKDIREHRSYPLELVDNQKRYVVGAAVNTYDYRKRVPALAEAGADILFVDASQGYSDYQEAALKHILKNFPGIPVIGGNVATKEGFDFLVQNGAHGVKIGMGPGSICTTREKYRIGRPQATAVIEINQRRHEYLAETGIYVPIIADGGIVTNDHFFIAFALGADSVMGGRFFARFHESPTETTELKETYEGRVYVASVKPYWGEGSERAKIWRRKRYDQAEESEGIEGYVPYAGYVKDNLPSAVRHIKTSMQKNGYFNIRDVHAHVRLQRESASTIKEGMPHDIFVERMWRPYRSG
ncbi:MAG: IMP dehydrogenase [Candidatus Aenigmarchaeota archaeon]|nr:IMP dehydrogenase [Candidatus Aenigmarchaeota archaeon]